MAISAMTFQYHCMASSNDCHWLPPFSFHRLASINLESLTEVAWYACCHVRILQHNYLLNVLLRHIQQVNVMSVHIISMKTSQKPYLVETTCNFTFTIGQM